MALLSAAQFDEEWFDEEWFEPPAVCCMRCVLHAMCAACNVCCMQCVQEQFEADLRAELQGGGGGGGAELEALQEENSSLQARVQQYEEEVEAEQVLQQQSRLGH